MFKNALLPIAKLITSVTEATQDNFENDDTNFLRLSLMSVKG